MSLQRRNWSKVVGLWCRPAASASACASACASASGARARERFRETGARRGEETGRGLNWQLGGGFEGQVQLQPLVGNQFHHQAQQQSGDEIKLNGMLKIAVLKMLMTVFFFVFETDVFYLYWFPPLWTLITGHLLWPRNIAAGHSGFIQWTQWEGSRRADCRQIRQIAFHCEENWQRGARWGGDLWEMQFFHRALTILDLITFVFLPWHKIFTTCWMQVYCLFICTTRINSNRIYK